MSARIELCGRLTVEIEGRRIEDELPGRQGRLVVAYLASRGGRPVGRAELIDVLWPEDPPADPEETLSALLSKVRRALGRSAIQGRQELTIDASVDLDDALAAVDRAEAATDARAAWEAANAALELTGRGFLAGLDAPWAQERRRDVDHLRLRALEAAAAAGTALGDPELAAGERAARALIEAAPFRESGHRHLMAALAARGNVAEALQVYEDVRVRLRDELGVTPSAALQEQHRRLLTDGGGPPAPAPEREEPPREERKLVSVLFAELSGRRLDPEVVRPVLAPYRARVLAELERFGGTVDHFDGGALLAVFGSPVAHEDDAERAVRSGLRIVEIAREVAHDAPELEPTARAAVATGEALVGASLEGHVGGVALGLLGAAGAGGVVVDDATANATRHAVEYAPVEGGWDARGMRERAPTASTPFLGREHELAMLQTLYRTVVDERRPRLVAIVGEPGVGKTRLTDELVRRTPGAVLRGRCLPYGEGITYWALREILWAAAGILLDDGAATATEKLGALVRRLVDEPERTTAALARTAGIAVAGSPLDRLTNESVAEELGLAWPRFLGALASERPTVVVVEDLHWAERPLLEMLERLVARSSGPLLIVATARPEFRGWSAAPGISQLALEPLTEAQSRELVERLMPGASAGLRQRVVTPAEGNPFFAEELARHVASGGAGAIPNSVRALIAARIDALPDAEKRVLHDAAVVGRVFWATTLEQMGGRPVRDALRALEEKGLVVASPTSVLPGQLELSFRHALKREVAYESVPRARRCRAHAGVARWIEELAGDRRPEFVDLLAYHYEAAATGAGLAWPDDAGERDRLRRAAVEALLAAGEDARTRLSVEQAVRYADRALAMAEEDEQRLEAIELRASSLHAAVRSDEAFAAYREALDVAHRLGDATARARLRAHAALLCARYSGAFTGVAWRAAAVELVERGLEELGDDGESFEVGALLIGRSAIRARWFEEPTGREEAAEADAHRAIEIADAIGSTYLLSHAVEALVEFASRGGFCDAGALGERLAGVSETMPDRLEAHEGLVTAAISLARAGRYERAREVARAATRESGRLSPHHATHAAAGEAVALVPAGRFAELVDVTAGIAAVVREEGGRLCQMGALGLAGRALALHELGERDAAAEAVAVFEAAPVPRGLVPFRCLAIEMLRPVAGAEWARTAAASCGACRATVTGRMHDLRLELQLGALSGGTPSDLVTHARELALEACAPTLGWIADWAEAVERSDVARARAAARALEAHGEPYTAARLLLDLLPFLDAGPRRPLAEDVAERLARMGARTSAAEARRLYRSSSVLNRSALRTANPSQSLLK